jgi:hypothetical protein
VVKTCVSEKRAVLPVAWVWPRKKYEHSCLGFASRVAASLLTAIDLPELITSTPAAYEELAVELALHPDRLDTIRQNRLTTLLFDSSLFTRHIEKAYEVMYTRYQADLPVAHFHVRPCESDSRINTTFDKR